MKHIAIIGTILVLLLLTAGCVDNYPSTIPSAEPDICNCTVNGVAYNVTSGICHGFSANWAPAQGIDNVTFVIVGGGL